VHEAICDTSPIQYLHQIGFLHLLAEFYTRAKLCFCGAAWQAACRLATGTRGDCQSPRRMPSCPTEIAPFLAVTVLGRLHAEALKLSFTGTLGILLRAKVEGRILRIEPLLANLGRLGFRQSAKTHAAVLRQAGK
jgi:predicted nucleic acid-binding protein